jgi:hypothetical protein
MAVGLAVAEANSLLTSHTGGTAHTPPAAYWLKMHVGDPGAVGTANPAVNTTRKQVTWAAAANGGRSNSAAMTWTAGEVTTTEDYSHWSAWTASTAGTFLASGTITAPSAVAGQEYILAIGDVDLTLSVATT